MVISDIDKQAGIVTVLLARVENGDREAEAQLLPLVHNELLLLARRRMANERKDHTLQATALVNEAFLRIFRGEPGNRIEGREHFFALAATVMRQILVDHARSKNAEKRGGGQRPVALEDTILSEQARSIDVIALDEALNRLNTISPRASRLVELSFFGGLTIDQASVAMGISSRTLKRDWKAARTWLHKEIYGRTGTSVGSDL